MYKSLDESSIDQLYQKIENLEDLYAEALKDDMDALSLSAFWEHIKQLKKQLELPDNS